MKLLNLPADVAHLLYGISRVLRHVVRGNKFRFVGRDNYPEKFQLLIFGKSFNFNDLSLLKLFFTPGQ